MGIRYSYISEIELGKRNISVLTLLRITHVLRIPAVSLFTEVDPHAALSPLVTCDLLPAGQVREAVATPDAPPTLGPDNSAKLLSLLGATLRHYRQQQGLSQPALAAKTDLSFGYISEIENGHRNLSVLSLIHIAEALALPVAALLMPFDPYCNPSPPLSQ